MLKIETINKGRQLNEFIRFPWKIYRSYPKWVPPLISDQRKYFDRSKNPFYQHSEADLFLVRDKSGQVVGRIAAVKYQKHLDIYNDSTGFFGFFECIDNQKVADMLFERVREWLLARKLTRMRGPMSFTINDDCGLLVKGFEYDPIIGMPYNPPYYEKLFLEYGLAKSQDLYSFHFKPEYVTTEFRTKVMKTAERVEKKGFTLRPFSFKDLYEDSQRLQQVYESAWDGNWGHIPMEIDDFVKIACENRSILDLKICWIVEYKNETAGLIFCFPDYAPVIRSMNGHIFPLGFIKFLINKRKVSKFRVILLGILKEYRNLGLESLILKKMDIEYPQRGYREGEFAWILESNRKMISTIERLGAKLNKTYRIFDKEIK